MTARLHGVRSRLLLWIAVKNAVHPFRRLITRYLKRRHEKFDRQAGVCTAGTVTVEALGLSARDSHRYDATPVGFFRSLLAKLAVDYENTVFVDLGSGKGRTLLLASHYPFRAIIGVEISRELCELASANLRTYDWQRRRCRDISVHCESIAEFEYGSYGRSDQLLLYLFNPCGEAVLRAGLEKIHRVVSRGATVTIVYVNPTCNEALQNADWLEPVRHGETFDETSNTFMPYIVLQSASAQWSGQQSTLPSNSAPGCLRAGGSAPCPIGPVLSPAAVGAADRLH